MLTMIKRGVIPPKDPIKEYIGECANCGSIYKKDETDEDVGICPFCNDRDSISFYEIGQDSYAQTLIAKAKE